MFSMSSFELRHHPRQRRHLFRGPVGFPESIKFINLIPPTSVALLLQYSGSMVEHRDVFSYHK